MDDERRPKSELIAELLALRARVADLETRPREGGARDVPRLLERIPALVWSTDLELRLTWWRGGGIRTLGLDPEALIGVDIYDFLGTRDPEHPSIQAHHAALEGEARNYELLVEGRWLRSHVEPLRDEGETIRGVIGVGLDITERVHAEEEREELIRDLREALDRVKTLSGLIPICVHCKSMRDDQGYWQQVDTFVSENSDAELSHGICPDCLQRLSPPAR